jgi:predicted NUDIX family phosphoesterase
MSEGPQVSGRSVLVVDRAALFGGDWPQGFVALDAAAAADFCALLERQARFEPRALAERTPAWKQPIPYCAVRRGPDQLFCVERLPTHGETRLHGRLSIGIGGHVEPVDGSPDGILARATLRELHEELVVPMRPAPRLVGLLNDDSDEVGSVHVGLVHLVELPATTPDDAVRVREISKLRGGFRGLAGPESLWHDSARLESWSALLLDVFLRQIGGSRRSSSDGSHPSTPPEKGHHGGAQDAEALS